jgi:hypothetical protein
VAAESSLEPGHASLGWAGGPPACRRHSAASPGSPDYCLCSPSRPQSAFGAKHGQTLAASGVIRHRNKGKNLRGAEQLEGPLPNGCSAPRASDPLYVLVATDLWGKRLTGAVARIFASRGGRGFWAGAAGRTPGGGRWGERPLPRLLLIVGGATRQDQAARPAARAPRRSSRGRSLARSPRRVRDCRVPAPAGRSFEDGPVRSTLLLSEAGRRG